VHRQEIDEGRGRVDPVCAARAHGRAEGLRQPHQAEVAHVHFLACDRQAVPLHDAAGPHVLGGVDDNVDAAAVLLGLLGARFGIGDVERHDLDFLDLAQRVLAGERLPRIGDADEHDVGAGLGEGLRHRLPHGGTAIGDQHAAEFRVAGHLAQLRIVGHVGGVFLRQRDQHGRAALVELEIEAHARAFFDVTVQMRQDDGAGVELGEARAPRRALAEVWIGRGADGGFGEHRAAIVDWHERHARRQALRAGVARRIEYLLAVGAALQLEPPLRRRRGQALRGAAADRLRIERLPRLLERVLPLGPDERCGHVTPSRARRRRTTGRGHS